MQDSDLNIIKRLLVRDSKEAFLSWMLTCFIPWSRIAGDPKPLIGKRAPTPACSAAKEGLKADNRICKIVDEAAHNLDQVILHKNASKGGIDAATSFLGQTSGSKDREIQGTAIRGWGANWRYNIIFAVLAEVAESRNPTMRVDILKQYANWLKEIEGLDLLDADRMKPIVNGEQLLKAIGVQKTGPWVKKALDVTMAWQLRHPHASDPSDALKEVIARRHELGIPD